MTSPDTSGAEPGSMKDARVIETETILPGPKRFIREALAMPDGNKIDWYYIDTPASVMVLPVTAHGTVVLIRQYRHNLKCHTLELPAGTLHKGEDPEEAAIRELEEETGFLPAPGGILQFVGRYYSLPSETNRYTYFFLARPVMSAGAARGDSEIEKYFDMSVTEIPLGDVFDSIGSKIEGIETAGALLLARKHLKL
jgi:ADP-ribose pyrophosphatase